MICALIMAGGKGTRFWPLSTEEKPKQFLNLVGNDTMIQMTVDRIKKIVPLDRIFISTNERYVDLVREQLPYIREENIIVEPVGRNTAPCILLSAMIIKRKYKDGNMIVLPSDHLIEDVKQFLDIIMAADKFVTENKNAIITLGINPNRPETEYGYIQCSNIKKRCNNYDVIKVKEFKEKPTKERAIEYLKSRDYIWNSGMFIWGIDNIINQIKQYCNEIYEAIRDIEEANYEDSEYLINKVYKNIKAISIDKAVLEKSKDVYVIKCNFGWDDVGNWKAVERYSKKDESGNIFIGESIAINSENDLIISCDNKILVSGLSNIYVIQNNGRIIIGNRDNIEHINKLKEDF